jgi:uncharacterized protein with NRDE domain
MCVVALAIGVHPQYPVILLGNRDEFHTRPAAPLHAWTDGSGIIAGKDLQAGGTWLGIHPKTGRMVVVTNVRGDLPDPSKASRGALVSQLLSGTGPYAAPSPEQLDNFNAFNLIFVEGGAANILTNRPAPTIQRIESGVFAVANQPAFAPCARAERLQAILANHLAEGRDPHDLLDVLLLRDDPALFILGDPYGTRCSTLVLQDQHGQIEISERRYEAGGHPIGMTALKSQLG